MIQPHCLEQNKNWGFLPNVAQAENFQSSRVEMPLALAHPLMSGLSI